MNNLNNEMVGLATENDDLSAENKRLKEELADSRDAVPRGRTTWHSQSPFREPSLSLSPWSKAYAIGPPKQATSRRRDLSRDARRHARSQSRNHSEVARRGRREMTAATNNTIFTIASHSSVNVDPKSKSSIQVDRSIKDPDKFKGESDTFYQWLTAMTLKLSTAVFRSEEDGLRYVQGFLTGALWSLVAPRIPSLGGWGKPCPNPFPNVDSLMKLLTERYGEYNTEERAMNAMTSLRQGEKEDFNVFYAKYQEYQAYCALNTEKQEIHRLQGKLNSRFREKLADGMDCASTQELVNRYTRLQTQWESIDADKAYNHKRSDSRKGRGGNSKRGGKDKEDDATGSSGGRYARKIDLPEDQLPKEFKNMPPLTNELRTKLRETGGYYKCRRTGYQASQRDKCPLAILEDAYEKRTKVNQVQVENAPKQGNGIATR